MAETNWQKSSYCEAGSTCVYLAAGPRRTVLLRESDAPTVVLTAAPGALRPLITRIKSGTLSASAPR
ncbi:DUF397 domain-containing protein [Streptomyces nondiastaticus]|uniref:DUF397 domain-containing protein n=1 Tax=Streptomyces nondiastaticus TaxID=3154512 RepID=UPI00341A3F5B